MHLARLPQEHKEQGRRLMDNFAVAFMQDASPEVQNVFEAELEPMLRREPSSKGRRTPPVSRAMGLSRGGKRDAVQRSGEC